MTIYLDATVLTCDGPDCARALLVPDMDDGERAATFEEADHFASSKGWHSWSRGCVCGDAGCSRHIHLCPEHAPAPME